MQIFLEICLVIVLALAIPSVIYLVRPDVLPDFLSGNYTKATARAHLLVTFELLLITWPRLAHWNSGVGLACASIALVMIVGQLILRRRASSPDA